MESIPQRERGVPWILIRVATAGALLAVTADASASVPISAPLTNTVTPTIGIVWVLPFMFMLGAIAVAPFIHKKWWEETYHLVVIVLGAIASAYYILGPGEKHRWVEGMSDYISFI